MTEIYLMKSSLIFVSALVNAKNVGTSFNLVFYDDSGIDSGQYITAQSGGNEITLTVSY